MRDAEEVAREAWQAVADSIHRDDQSAVDAMAEVIRARDAEVLRDAADAIDGGADEGDLDPLDFNHHTDYGEALAARKVRERADRIERGERT